MNDTTYLAAARRMARLMALAVRLHAATPALAPRRGEIVARYLAEYDDLSESGARASLARCIERGLAQLDGDRVVVTVEGAAHADAHAHG